MAGADPKRTLIVDFGGVLTTDIWTSFRAFCEAEGLEPDTIKESFRSAPQALETLRALERGDLADEEFEQRFAAIIGIPEPEGLIGRLFAGLELDERMYEAVRACRRAGRQTALISNSWGTGIYERGNFDGLFDEIVISGEVGMHKPEPEIFELALERLGAAAQESVFVDDLRENVEGAERVGMTAILHRDTQQTIARLEELLALDLSAARRA